MSKSWKVLLCLGMLACLTMPASAQSNELAFTAGGQFPTGKDANFDPAFAFEASFAHRLASVPLVSLYFELPVAAGFNSTAKVGTLCPTGSTCNPLKADYSSVFFTPGFKVKFAPGLPVSPYFVAGGGWARFNPDNASATNTNVFDFGGGVDMKVAPFVSLRGEVRDFYSGGFRLSFADLPDRQHNILATGGLVLRF